MNLHFTQHASVRIRQRGLRERDIQIIVDYGTPVDDDSVLLLNQDVEREVRKRKREIAMLERLRGYRVVVAGEEKVVTVYRPVRKIEKRLLRGTHRHSRVDSLKSNKGGIQFTGLTSIYSARNGLIHVTRTTYSLKGNEVDTP